MSGEEKDDLKQEKEQLQSRPGEEKDDLKWEKNDCSQVCTKKRMT